MKKGLIFLNGDPPKKEILRSIDYTGFFVICADGALDYIKDFVRPDVLLGDFDSLRSNPSGKEVLRFPVDKDYTDGHLAVGEAAKRGLSEVEIFGAFGGRPDHEYANFALLYLADALNIRAVIRGDYDIYYVKDEIRLQTKAGSTVSLVPFTDKAHIIKTEGLKFDASSLTMTKRHLIGMSNEAIGDEFYVSVGEGGILLFVQRS